MHLMGELRCEATDSRAMGLAVPWYRRGGTSMEASIPCSFGGRVLVAKGAEEVENAEANSKYQDRVEGQMLRNFIRLVSTGRGALHNGFDEDIEGISGENVTDKNVNKVFAEMFMFVRVLRFVYIPCTASSGLAVEAPCARATVRRSRQQGAALVEVLPAGMAPARRGDRPRLAVPAVGAVAHSIIVG
ncbi:hypothetical protein BHE74_00012956 [Ensete ventricosum]|nr:hypothetical protein BHE74_00012956 [Ensete ventricosum]